ELEREGVYSFRMPDADVEVEVTFAPGYEITIDDDIRYGEITTDPEDYAAEDDTVEVYFKPSNGYKLKTIEVFTGKDFDDEVTVRLHSSGDYYRFTMPDGDVYITAEFERTTMPFTDVRTTDWYYDEVLYVYNNGLMEGVSSYSFNPSGTMTREMFWAVLGRIDGQSITGTNWASQARSWAMNEGVSDGTNPTSLITREEMVTMLWRYAGSRAASGGLSRFNDASTISSWASTAMSWAVNNGIIDGVTSNTIQPRGTADRAQCAAIFMRYDQM
ncbi:MAG TPA: S-layer homology domain-containing protein, partial [Candidatus Scatomorpha merdigallinarum]|nr:S-layer homology domain-containing protein [Candidatus Scatomorpha merdigallinarum]